jgi:5-formyltetrahydrofolate cyclo-ligase
MDFPDRPRRSPTTPSAPPPRGPAEASDDDLRRRVKRELRKRARGVRVATPSDACQKRSASIVARLLSLEPLMQARTVALFWPIVDRHEVDLRGLDTALRARGVKVAYPALAPEDDEASAAATPYRAMTFHVVDDTARLEERGNGFAEPPPGAPALDADLHELDAVVLPALALDPSGQRIGYGAGYYDRALAGTSVLKVGVIFDFELLPEVPSLPDDVPVDWVVTDRRSLRTEAARAEGADGAGAPEPRATSATPDGGGPPCPT